MGKWAQGKLRLSSIKQSFNHWYDMLKNKGWNVIYWHNHDQPRVISHYGDDSEYWEVSAKMLGMALYFMPGSAICYQGEEIGMTNVHYQSLEQFRDVEVFTEYNNMIKKGLSKDEALEVIKARCRDNARTPMQWDDSPNGGFSTVTPWIDTNDNYQTINVKKQDQDPSSILAMYQKILNLRNEDDNIGFGQLTYLDIDDEQNYSYLNIGATKDYLVICNFSKQPLAISLKNVNLYGFVHLMGNYSTLPLLTQITHLLPFETHVYRRVIDIT
jgi:glycosidase